jgi:hypothetical protein
MAAAPQAVWVAEPGRLVSPWYLALSSPRSAAAVRREQSTLVLFVLVTLLALNLYAPAQPAPVIRLLASLLIILGALPVWLWNSGTDKGMPLLPFIAFFYSMYYALPVFVMKRYSVTCYSRSTIPDSFLEYAVLLSCVGWVATLAGYYCPVPRRLMALAPRMRLNWTDARVLQSVGCTLGTVGCLLYYAGFTSRAYETDYAQSIPDSLRQVVFFLGESATMGIGILYVLQQMGCLGGFAKLYLWVILIPVRALVGLATGAVYQAISLVLFLLFIHSAMRRKIRWSLILCGMAAFTILQPTKTLLRTFAAVQTESVRDSPHTRAMEFFAIAYRVATRQVERDVDVFQMAMDRLNSLSTLARTVELTPAVIPFWNGETYRALLEKPIPRFIYPDKLDENAGQAFGHRYGLLGGQDDTTSYNLPELVEAYVNFGIWGVALVMFLTGIFYRVGQDMFVHPSMGIGALVGGGYVMSTWLNIESNTSLVLGGLPTAIAFIGCVHFLVSVLEGNHRR